MKPADAELSIEQSESVQHIPKENLETKANLEASAAKPETVTINMDAEDIDDPPVVLPPAANKTSSESIAPVNTPEKPAFTPAKPPERVIGALGVENSVQKPEDDRQKPVTKNTQAAVQNYSGRKLPEERQQDILKKIASRGEGALKEVEKKPKTYQRTLPDTDARREITQHILSSDDDSKVLAPKLNSVPEVKVRDPRIDVDDDDYRCLEHTFGTIKDEPWVNDRSKVLNVWDNAIKGLAEQGYKLVPADEAESNDVVVYGNTYERIPSPREPTKKEYLLRPKHFGVLQENGKVESKIGIGPIIEHPVDAVSYRYGKTACFFRKETEEAEKPTSVETSEALDVQEQKRVAQPIEKASAISLERSLERDEITQAMRDHLGHEDDPERCVAHAFDTMQQESWAKSKIELKKVWRNPNRLITEHGYQPVTDTPMAGDLAMYGFSTDGAASVNHYGVLQEDGKIRSKFTTGPVVDHELHLIPYPFGDEVRFLRKSPSLEEAISKVTAHKGYPIAYSNGQARMGDILTAAYNENYMPNERSSETIAAVLEKLSDIPGVEILERRDFLAETYDCTAFTFNVTLQEPWAAEFGQRLFHELPENWRKHPVAFLVAHGYEMIRKEELRPNDVVIYGFSRENSDPILRHVGTYQEDGHVVSKLGQGPVVRHPLEAIPPIWGDRAYFLRKTTW
jgi:acetolactate synthase regulatory subunit